MSKRNALVMAILVACGGHKAAETTPQTTGPGPAVTEGGGDDMIAPEKMDQVEQELKRKEMIVSHCLATAMENKDVPKGTHGHVAFEIKISPEGHATDIAVIKTDIEAPAVIECAKKHIQDIAFPTLPKAYETSHRFAMEAN